MGLGQRWIGGSGCFSTPVPGTGHGGREDCSRRVQRVDDESAVEIGQSRIVRKRLSTASDWLVWVLAPAHGLLLQTPEA